MQVADEKRRTMQTLAGRGDECRSENFVDCSAPRIGKASRPNRSTLVLTDLLRSTPYPLCP